MYILRHAAIFLAVAPLFAQTVEQPVRSVTDPGMVTTRQAITPAGVPTVFQGRVYGVVFGKSESELWVLHANRIYRLDWLRNTVLNSVPFKGRPGLQGIAFDSHSERAIAAVAPPSGVELHSTDGTTSRLLAGKLGDALAGSLEIASSANADGQRLAAIPIVKDNKLALVDLASQRVLGTAATGIAPFGCVLSRDGKTAYVSNWGGRIPREKDLTAPTGLAKDADQVVIDKRGIASTGTVTRIDLQSLKTTHTVVVGLHPTAMAWDESSARLYVVNSNSDSISVIDTRKHAVVQTISLKPFHTEVKGIAPTAIRLSSDKRRLYVACGGINAVVVLDPASGRFLGAIPTAWYPNDLALSPDGKHLAVTALLGVGSGWQGSPDRRFVHAYRGAVSVIPLPDEAQLANYTTAVAENNRMQPAGAVRPAARPANVRVVPKAIPLRSGDPSLIEHVVYVIKENRTYDQLFGDLGKGNGEPRLVMFGEPVAPNHRRMAEQFVLLDNFYATGGNSADGHQWVTQANQTAYALWPGYIGRSYPFDGTDPIAYSEGGFLWDLALKAGKSVRVYGEFAPRMPEPTGRERLGLLEAWKRGEDFSSRWSVSSPIPPLDKLLARNFPTYTNAIPDVVRAQIFLKDFAGWEKDGKMPNLTILQLPCDHTFGTTPDVSTPKAMVADNDLALGKIVEALSKSRFWSKMAILVVEDDAQNGVDHVDGHRTVALAVSPYVRRGHVDSTFYSHQSMLKTIELILGLPTMSLFDLIANDMRASFQDTPNLEPYSAVEPQQSLFELNPPAKALRGKAREGALASARMRWDVPDAAPTETLNRILWHSIKGWDVPYPAPKTALFAPLSLDIDDEDREMR